MTRVTVPREPQATRQKTATTVQSHNLSATEYRRRSWTQRPLSGANYLKVPASVWKNIHDPTRTERIDAAENTLASALAAGALTSIPIIGLVRVHKWFWDKSIETKGRKDTYRYRVIDQATKSRSFQRTSGMTPSKTTRPKSKSYFMNTIENADQWRQYLSPCIPEGFSQIKKSTTYGWSLIVNRKKSRNAQLPNPAASPRSKKSAIRDIAR
ncbi:hypothetical protein HO133_001681 [Letharia lupina]|uniref:Uncharacterized protein n=1 Tax=Letharia lupina TaxID=560253 RepID=A0A8H6CDU3_9LECA|nr:uncharacterized protein HO133_001681 [Letharia lupina]KAF6221713.1 hypothetical protein HO133_001681 [Letharia lupina]